MNQAAWLELLTAFLIAISCVGTAAIYRWWYLKFGYRIDEVQQLNKRQGRKLE